MCGYRSIIAPNERSGFLSTRTTKGGLSAMARSFLCM
jgi:hypothetical protein